MSKHERFEEFWRNYPRKVAKKNAQKAWNALKPDQAMAERIMFVLQLRKEYEWVQANLDRTATVPKSAAFIPYPATFLRREDFSPTEEVEAIADDKEPPPLFMAAKVKA